jgi:Fe-S cluster assembly ATP-binding protein
MNTLSVKNLTVNIEGLSRVSTASLELKSGELICLLGANGSGKSSLLRGIVSSTDCIINGEIVFNNVDITQDSIDEKARKGIFFSPQQTPNIEGVKLISLIYGAYTRTTKDKDLLSIIDIRKKLIELAQKHGLKPDIIDRPIGIGLSGGEKKQSELLQLLILEPAFCLLDEPDSGVDIDTIKVLVGVIKSLQSKGTAILLVSHNINMLEDLVIDRTYLIKNGSIIKTGGSEIIEDIKKNGF